MGKLNILRQWWWFFPGLLLGSVLALGLGSSAAFMRDITNDAMGYRVIGTQLMVWLLPIMVTLGFAVYAFARHCRGLAIGMVIGMAMTLGTIYLLGKALGGASAIGGGM